MADVARGAYHLLGVPLRVVTSTDAFVEALNDLDVSEIVLDRTHDDAEVAAHRLGALGTSCRVLCVAPDTTRAVVRAHALVVAPVLRCALIDLAVPREARVPSSVNRLLQASVLTGTLEDAIEDAAHEIAVAFGVAGCVVFQGGEPTGSVETEGATWDASAWDQTAKHCRAALALDTSLIVSAPPEPGACDSYVAVPLDSPRGDGGFVALRATKARVFTADERATLCAIAARFARELRWRVMQDRTTQDLDRALSGPGQDPTLAIWNRTALDQIAHAYVSNAKRTELPLAVLAVRVVDLEGVNTRHGMKMGDRMLRRVADGLKPGVRGEDIVGRYSGTVFVVLLQNARAQDAKLVATRIQAILGERSLELVEGGELHIATTVGIAVLGSDDDAVGLLRRTVHGTKRAPDNVIAMLSAATTVTDRVALVTDSDLQMRSTLGGAYRLRHEISRGGMGVVYRADDRALERPVAIKMLRPELAQNDELVKHLRREASLLARVHHPNLVQIFNFGQSEGDCYFVMELVEGESLQQAIERHRAEGSQMGIPELLAVIDQIASALDALHERGIVHRDIKPANFIRDPFTGRCVLVDVGIAHKFGELSKQAGTPGFMAPEVIQGVVASPRSDVYGLAASMFEMATLSPPWGDGDPIEILMKQCSDPPRRVSTVRPELEPIDELLAHALSFDIDQRPATAGELARELARQLGTIVPVTSTRTTRRTKQEPAGAVPRTRGVVFRSALGALAVRDVDRLRDAIGEAHADLAEALAQCAPLAWAPSELLVRLLDVAPNHVARDATALARDIARETIRTSFRSFFPASPETLHPDRTLSAIRGIWSRYHSWGNVSAIPIGNCEIVVRVQHTLKVRAMCVWTDELLTNLVSLSGGRDTRTLHEACELDGDDACAFRVTWHE